MKGKLVVFEGIDGSGKNTQATILHKYLLRLGIDTIKLHFPLYTETFFGKEVGLYLNGKFGDINSVNPKFASMLYAGDRFEKKEYISQSLNAEKCIICDRYVPSNVAHHSAKLPKDKQNEFSAWIETLEYKIFGIPKPDIVIFLDVPPEMAKSLVLQKSERNYTSKKQDLHEADQKYLAKVYERFVELSELKNWHRVKCFRGHKLKNANEIAYEIQSFISKT